MLVKVARLKKVEKGSDILSRSGRPKVLNSVQHNLISQWLTENNELSINDIVLTLQAEGVHAS